jgi:hypothetical protein
MIVLMLGIIAVSFLFRECIRGSVTFTYPHFASLCLQLSGDFGGSISKLKVTNYNEKRTG